MGFVLSPAFAPESHTKYGVILVRRNNYGAVQLLAKCMVNFVVMVATAAFANLIVKSTRIRAKL